MVTPIGLVVGVAFAAAGAYLAYQGIREIRLGTDLLRAAPTSVRSLTEGMPGQVALQGTARALEDADAETVEAPFSGRPSVVAGHEVLALESRYNASTRTYSQSWRTVDEGWSSVPFLLDDGTGRVRVEPAAATFSVAPDEETRVAGGRTPPDHILSFVERTEGVDDGGRGGRGFGLGPFDLDLFGGGDRRYVERRIEPGDEVAVYGTPTAARGGVGEVNAVVRGGDPFVVADTTSRWAGWRHLKGGALPLLFGLVFLALGVFVAVLF